jgi:hypothetical protein
MQPAFAERFNHWNDHIEDWRKASEWTSEPLEPPGEASDGVQDGFSIVEESFDDSHWIWGFEFDFVFNLEQMPGSELKVDQLV